MCHTHKCVRTFHSGIVGCRSIAGFIGSTNLLVVMIPPIGNYIITAISIRFTGNRGKAACGTVAYTLTCSGDSTSGKLRTNGHLDGVLCHTACHLMVSCRHHILLGGCKISQ